MSRLHKILLGIFCGGVLLCGIGLGVMVLEFSEVSYGGIQIVGETKMETKDIDVKFEPGEAFQTGIRNVNGYGDIDEILEDPSVPQNTVRFRVTYNEARVKPMVYCDEENHEIYFQRSWNGGDDLAVIMEVKDLLLEGIRERKIYAYDAVDFEEIQVKINPSNRDDVYLLF